MSLKRNLVDLIFLGQLSKMLKREDLDKSLNNSLKIILKSQSWRKLRKWEKRINKSGKRMRWWVRIDSNKNSKALKRKWAYKQMIFCMKISSNFWTLGSKLTKRKIRQKMKMKNKNKLRKYNHNLWKEPKSKIFNKKK